MDKNFQEEKTHYKNRGSSLGNAWGDLDHSFFIGTVDPDIYPFYNC
jgi:hypothetical protein